MNLDVALATDLVSRIWAAVPEGTPHDAVCSALLALLCTLADKTDNVAVIADLMHATADELVKPGPRFVQHTN